MYGLGDFEKVAIIGEGTYGKVYKAINKITGEFCAIKKFLGDKENTDGLLQTTLREICALRDLKHPNIVELLLALMQKGRLYLIFEFVQCDLRKYLDDINMPLPPPVLQNFSYQIMQGVLFCHQRRLIHRDLKPQNILVDNANMTIKIADFGLARTFGSPIRPITHEVCTLWYRPPEILLGVQRYSCAVDVWSVACIIAEMAVFEVYPDFKQHVALFRGDCEIEQLFKIFQLLGTPTEKVWPNVTHLKEWNNFPIWKSNIETYLKKHVVDSLSDLLQKMLIYNPNQRLILRDALMHPYFHDLNKETLPAHGEEGKSCPSTILKYYRGFKESDSMDID